VTEPSVAASLGEVRAGLAEVSEHLGTAYRCARTAQQRLVEAVGVVCVLDRAHHDQLVSPELLRAGHELTRALELISGGADSVAAIAARL